jgi:hypothetical protein
MTACPQASVDSSGTACEQVLRVAAPHNSSFETIEPSTIHPHPSPRIHDQLPRSQPYSCSLSTPSTGATTPAIFLTKELKSNKQDPTRVHTTEELL